MASKQILCLRNAELSMHLLRDDDRVGVRFGFDTCYRGGINGDKDSATPSSNHLTKPLTSWKWITSKC